MKHFTNEEWADYVNQMISSGQRTAMQRHLESGCNACAGTVELWQKVRTAAALEASYQPPVDAVRTAKAAFAAAGMTAKPKKTSSLVEVLFDSFLQPAVAGARSSRDGARQMLYRADPYQIDIHIEAKAEGNRVVITGQVLDVSNPALVGKEIQISISNHRGSLVHTTTNQFGEFHGEIENTGDLHLSIPRPHENQIVISLRKALDRLPGGVS